MKKQLLFGAMVIIGLASTATVTAEVKTKVAPKGPDFKNTVRYRYVEPIMFIERGVEFLIFPDGSFDFNTNLNNPSKYQDQLYYHGNSNSRRSRVHGTQAASRASNYYGTSRNHGVIIQYDHDGKLKRIGNVSVNYDRTDKIKRIGSVHINYDRSGKLAQVGGLQVRYNRWDEIVSTRGVVNRANTKYSYGGYYTTAHASPVYNHHYYNKKGDPVKKQKKIKR